MLETSSPLQKTMLQSPLRNQSAIRPHQGKRRRGIVASLILTSLVDAFSILVIFLLMNHSANQRAIDVHNVQLPQTIQSDLIQQGIVVRIEGRHYFFDKKEVSKNNLVSELKALKGTSANQGKDGVIIVADKSLSYEDLSPIIVAGSQAGFSKFKFAVVRKD